MIAEFIEFNTTWIKDCIKCGGHYGTEFSVDGLTEFFYRDASRSDGLSNKCKKCFANKKQLKTSVMRRVARYQWRHPKRHAAHMAVRNAIKSGKLSRPSICQECVDDGSKIKHYPGDGAIILAHKLLDTVKPL